MQHDWERTRMGYGPAHCLKCRVSADDVTLGKAPQFCSGAETETPTSLANDAAPYGRCPECNAPGVTRERRPNGNDTCTNGHTYPSWSAVGQLLARLPTGTVIDCTKIVAVDGVPTGKITNPIVYEIKFTDNEITGHPV